MVVHLDDSTMIMKTLCDYPSGPAMVSGRVEIIVLSPGFFLLAMADRRLFPNIQDPSIGRQEDLDYHLLLRPVHRVAYTLEKAWVLKVTKTALAVRRTLPAMQAS